MLTPDGFGLSDLHYRIHGHQLLEFMPAHCPAGHPFVGGSTVLIGSHPMHGLHRIVAPYVEVSVV